MYWGRPTEKTHTFVGAGFNNIGELFLVEKGAVGPLALSEPKFQAMIRRSGGYDTKVYN